MQGIFWRLAILVVAAGVTGCGTGDSPSPAAASPLPEAKSQPASRLTAENYLKIKEGMPSDEVSLILGTPTETKQIGSQFHRHWQEGTAQDTKAIYVVSEAGTVTSKWQVGLK